jgi:hypothetical protein
MTLDFLSQGTDWTPPFICLPRQVSLEFISHVGLPAIYDALDHCEKLRRVALSQSDRTCVFAYYSKPVTYACVGPQPSRNSNTVLNNPPFIDALPQRLREQLVWLMKRAETSFRSLADHCVISLLQIVIGVLNQQRSQGGLQVVNKVGGGQVNQSINGGGWSKNTKPKTGGAKGKLTLHYESEEFLSSDSNDSTPKAIIVKSRSDSVGKHSIKEMLKTIQERDKKIRALELELSKTKVNSRMSKMNVQEELNWTGEETTFVETVNNFCWYFLFLKLKFLKDGWKEILPKKKKSLYSLCMCHLQIPEGADESDIWERAIVLSIMKKNQHIKCNLNSEIKSIYMSMITCLCHYDFAVRVNYTYIDFVLS